MSFDGFARCLFEHLERHDRQRIFHSLLPRRFPVNPFFKQMQPAAGAMRVDFSHIYSKRQIYLMFTIKKSLTLFADIESTIPSSTTAFARMLRLQ